MPPKASSTSTAPTTVTADVLIVGGGLSGLTLALGLDAAGIKPVVVEKAPFETNIAPAHDGRASAIACSSFRMWQALGVAARLQGFQPINHIVVCDGPDPSRPNPRAPSALRLDFSSEELAAHARGEALGYLVENRHARMALLEEARARGIALMDRASLTDWERSPQGVTAKTASGCAIEAKLMVAADGRQSVIRTQAGIGLTHWGYGQDAVVCTVAFERPHEGTAYEYFLPHGPFAILPLVGNRANIVWTERRAVAETLIAMSMADFTAELSTRFGAFLGSLQVETQRWRYPLGLQLAERVVDERLVLVADAAHGIHPIAGQGLNIGLRDVATLCDTLFDARMAGLDIGAPSTLETYATWRRFDTLAIAAASDVFTRLFSNDHPLLRAARNLGLAATDAIGPVRRFFMREAAGTVGDLPRLLRGETFGAAPIRPLAAE